jgi:ribosomal protein L14E/L6E/L27E
MTRLCRLGATEGDLNHALILTCTAHEIAAITGHASLKEVERYTKGVDQIRLAKAAMQKMRATVQENETHSASVNPRRWFDKMGENIVTNQLWVRPMSVWG